MPSAIVGMSVVPKRRTGVSKTCVEVIFRGKCYHKDSKGCPRVSQCNQ